MFCPKHNTNMEKNVFTTKKKIASNRQVHNLEINKIVHIFNAIYATHSFTKAAKLLNKDKSSLSRGINKLEYILRQKLFTRHGRKGVIPNEQADQFFFYADKIQTINQKISSHYHIDAQPSTQLNICCHPLGVKYIFAAADKLQPHKIKIQTTNRTLAYEALLLDKCDVFFFPYKRTI